MTSTKKTLDYLVSMQQKEKLSLLNTNDKNKKHQHHQKQHTLKPPPVIPPSPILKSSASSPSKVNPHLSSYSHSHSHDEDIINLKALQTDLFLRKFELDAANTTWKENVTSKPEFKNPSIMESQLNKFGLSSNRYQYQSLIKHTNIHKSSRISELYEEGNKIQVVTNFTDTGCPAFKNPNAKKGCWCIEEKKQKKQHHHHNHNNHHSLSHSHHHHGHTHPIPPSMLHRPPHTHTRHLIRPHPHAHTHSHPHPLIKPSSMLQNKTIPNQAQSMLLAQTQQQKALNMMQHLKMFNVNQNPNQLQMNNGSKFGLSSVSHLSSLKPTPAGAVSNVAAMQGINSLGMKNGHGHGHGHGHQHQIPSTVGMIQNSLLKTARTQHYTPSNRMQQIRMQQMLLSSRTYSQSQQSTDSVTNNKNTTTGNNKSILGVRQHKDTIVFSNNGNLKAGEPPTKRRKKSRWAS